MNLTAHIQTIQRPQILHAPEIKGCWLRRNLECRDCRGRCGIRKWLCCRLDNRDALPPELFQDQRPYQRAVIHIQPFSGRDERPEIAWARAFRRRQEKIHVKPGKLARGVAKFRGLLEKPVLPFRRDLMMPNVRRIPYVESGDFGFSEKFR